MQEQVTASERDEVATRLAVVVGRLNRLIRSGDGFTASQLSALSSIVRLGPLRFGDLARVESISAPSATRLVAGLESAGYVERTADPTDGRAVMLTATEAGQQAVLEARKARADNLAHLLDARSDDEVGRIGQVLAMLEQTVDEGSADLIR